MSGVLEDRVLMVLPFMVLLLPLAGFIVLCLFGDAILHIHDGGSITQLLEDSEL